MSGQWLPGKFDREQLMAALPAFYRIAPLSGKYFFAVGTRNTVDASLSLINSPIPKTDVSSITE